jgi:hydrogenase-4 component F
VSGLGSIYGLSYWSREEHETTATKLTFFYALMTIALAIVFTARNSLLFLLAWEIMAVSAFLLVATEDESEEVRHASWIYLVATHIGTVCLFAAFALLRKETGSFTWAAGIAPSSRISLVFVLALIGFGFKAGLAPLHFWLPGAHANAPSHVSALLSGVLLKCALFVIIRYYLITAQSTGTALPQLLFLVFGLLSIAVAALFIFAQRDIKRLLAYSSVENIGLIVVGLGLGGVGIFAALLHTINHSIVKSLMFCTSGNVLIKYKTRDLGVIKGLLKVAPASTFMLMGGALALGGVPPFNIFVSELWTVSAGVERGSVWLMAAMLLFLVIVFAAFLRLISGSVFGPAPDGTVKGDVHWFTLLPIGLLLVLMILLGVSLPTPLYKLLLGATRIVTLGN